MNDCCRVFLDTDILISLAKIGGFSLIEDWEKCCFYTTEANLRELIREESMVPVTEAKNDGILRITDLTSPEEIETFAKVRMRAGLGEAAVIAAAIHRPGLVATHDRKARRIAMQLSDDVRVTKLEEIILRAIALGRIDKERARKIVQALEENGEKGIFENGIPEKSELSQLGSRVA